MPRSHAWGQLMPLLLAHSSTTLDLSSLLPPTLRGRFQKRFRDEVSARFSGAFQSPLSEKIVSRLSLPNRRHHDLHSCPAGETRHGHGGAGGGGRREVAAVDLVEGVVVVQV